MAYIRQIVPGDAPDLLPELMNLFSQLSEDPAPITAMQVSLALRSPSVTIIGAFEDRLLVGMGTLVLAPILNKTIASIQDVVVTGSERGKGVAKALIEALLVAARAGNASFCDLTSKPSRQAANSLYLRMGFKPRLTTPYRFDLL